MAKVAGSLLARLVFIAGLIVVLYLLSLFVRREIEETPRTLTPTSELQPLQERPDQIGLPPPEQPIRWEGRFDTRK